MWYEHTIMPVSVPMYMGICAYVSRYYIYITYMYYIYIYMCIWKALFQTTINNNPKIEVSMPMQSSKIMLWKRALHNYVLTMKTSSVYHIIICEKGLFQNTIYEHCKPSFLEWRLSPFRKELFVCVYIAYIYLRIISILCVYVFVLVVE